MYDEDSIDIRDSVVFEKIGYWGGMASSGDNFNFNVQNKKTWLIIAKIGDSIITREKICNVQAEVSAVMQNKRQIRKDEYITVRIKDFTAELEGISTNSDPNVWDGVQVSSSQGLKYRVDFEYKGLKNWQEGQVDFYEKEQQDASACETGIYMGH